MKVLTATSRTQGSRVGDFCYCVEGELVLVGLICAADRADPAAGACGCGRAFAGLNSHLATTTAVVRDIDFSFVDYVTAIQSSVDQQGYCPCNAEELAEDLARLARPLAPGTVLGRRGDELFIRHQPGISAGGRPQRAAPA